MWRIFLLELEQRTQKISLLDAGLDDLLKQHKAQVKKHGLTRLTLNRDQHPIRVTDFSRAALRTCETLRNRGYEAYLVGGCIRDLLLGVKPKDYDIATNATPEKVHAIFSSSRIIGRRFKIVHVIYGNELIEVTTFRAGESHNRKATVSDGHGMLVRDNTYGQDQSEDSERRDFTINALYFDPSDESITDFHGGLYDLNHGIIDIIGDPETRYAEDPVRMIRAVRFKAKLGFSLSKRTEKAIATQKSLLTNISNARMFEEVNKLFLSGHGQASLKELIAYDLLRLLMPGQKSIIADSAFREFVSHALESSDIRTARGQRNKPYFLYAVLLFTRVRSILEERNAAMGGDTVFSRNLIVEAANKALDAQNTATDIPTAIYFDITELYVLYFSLFSPYHTMEEINELVKSQYFRASYDLLKLRAYFEKELTPYVEFYAPYYDESARLAEERRRKREERMAEKRRQKRESRDRSVKAARAPRGRERKESADGYERDSAADRQERLARARAWRIAMNLDP